MQQTSIVRGMSFQLNTSNPFSNILTNQSVYFEETLFLLLAESAAFAHLHLAANSELKI